MGGRPPAAAIVTHHVRLADVLAYAVGDVREAFGLRERPADQAFDDLAIALGSRLHEAGYAIHANDGRCVRLAGPLPGRPMTTEELRMVGLAGAEETG